MQMNPNNTKEAYMMQALRLFAERGYEAVGVVEIARAVGCTTSAMYKHFPNKKALFQAIIDQSQVAFKENMARMKMDFGQEEQIPITVEEQQAMIHKLFEIVALGEFPRLFRKLMTVEQFKNPSLAEIYSRHYIDGQQESFENLMEIWIRRGILRAGNPKIMAVQYISPVILMIQNCDREPERAEEFLAVLDEHIRQFNLVYGV